MFPMATPAPLARVAETHLLESEPQVDIILPKRVKLDSGSVDLITSLPEI